MRILYVITRANRGGAQTNLLALASAAQNAGHQVTVITGENGWLTRELNRLGIGFQIIKSLRRSWNPFNMLLFLVDLRRFLQKNPTDVVHCHSSNTMPAVWAVCSLPDAPGTRPRTVFTVHGWSALSPGWKSWGPAYWFYRLAVHAFLPRYDRVVLVSQADYDLAMQHRLLPENRLKLIRNGIAPDRFMSTRENARRVLFSLLNLEDGGQPVVGTIARLDYAKNLAMLVAAADQVPHQEILYIIGGDGPRLADLRRQITEYGLDKRVHLIGPVIDTGDFLPAFDLFVMPSRFEGLPYALLEAGLAARPVVATPVGGIPEIVMHGTTGRLLANDSIAALAEEIDWFLHHREEAARLGQNLCQHVLEGFRQDKMARLTLKLYG